MIRITARHLKLGDGFTNFMRKALRKRVERFASKSGDPEVIVGKSGTIFKAEINYPYKRQRLLASNTGENAKKAFLGAMEKLRRQLEKVHDKKTDHAARIDQYAHYEEAIE